MALSIVNTRAQLGITAPAVSVEIHLSGGLPSLSIVGLPEAGVRESRERVRSALMTCDFEFPQRRITINLAPADLPKEGGRYDLAIAIGLLVASGQLNTDQLNQYELLGELSLSGELRPVTGVLPATIAAMQAQRTIIVPAENVAEACMVEGATVLRANHLLDVVNHFRAKPALEPQRSLLPQAESVPNVPDMADVKGQLQARRALEVAAAGQHNILFSGPPGAGKSMLAARLPGLLPALAVAERLEVASIHSVAGLAVDSICAGVRPFRAPHHTASSVALVGGGTKPRPGEISLSHQGVLFLDELPEFPRRVLEVLREPLESGEILISRVMSSTHYPARFQLVAAMNPCPCGYFGDGSARCRCTPDQIHRYQQRISGPLLDRIDIQLQVPALPAQALLQPSAPAESSAEIRQRVDAARQIQLQRQGCTNRELSARELEAVCALDNAERALLERIMTSKGLSARACHRLLKVARTLADLAQSDRLQREHLMEALAFRQLDLNTQRSA